ncbi:MAG: AI-2E family transporter [Bacteroides sp.]|nr:AI-2E family transporter [Bacteroides sp.]
MKYKWDKKYLYWGITVFAVFVAIRLFDAIFISGGAATVAGSGNAASGGTTAVGGFISKLLGALSPVFYGFAFAYLLNPVENFFEKSVFMRLSAKKRAKIDPEHNYGNEVMIKTKKRARVFGVVCAMVTFFVIITGVILIIIPQLISTIQKLVNNMEGYVNDTTSWINEQLANYPDAQKWINTNIGQATSYITEWLKDTIMPQMSNILTSFSSGLFTVVQVFTNVFFGIVIAIYFLNSKELFAAQLKKVLYSFTSPRYGNAIVRNMREVHRTFGGFLSGKIIDSLIIMLIFMVILTVFNFPYAVLCSVVMGIFNIIPVFGPFIGAVPCALLVLLEDPLYFLYFIGVVIVVQQLDGNVIGPMVLGSSTGLSSFWIIFALLLGQSIFGFIGLIIGIPLFAVIYSIFRARVGRKLESKGLPSDSNVYRKVAYVDENTGELITLYEYNERQIIKREQEELQKQTKHGWVRRHFTKKRHWGKAANK